MTDQFILRFQHLHDHGRAFSFPCNADGDVEMSPLSNTSRANYMRACQSVGTDFAQPVVKPVQGTLTEVEK